MFRKASKANKSLVSQALNVYVIALVDREVGPAFLSKPPNRLVSVFQFWASVLLEQDWATTSAS